MKIEKLYPAYKDYIWGGNRLNKLYGKGSANRVIAESWEASCHTDGETLLSDKTTLKDYIAKNPEVLGTRRISDEFPVLVKFIDAKSHLSLQVHPDDETAKALENGVGKTEMWYVIDAEKDSKIYCGIKTGVSKNDIRTAIENNTLESKLNVFDSKAGDCFFVAAGTVHAIGTGSVILEIQQNSNITYRLYDWGRVGKDGKPRDLHVEKGLRSIKLTPYRPRLTPTVNNTRVLGQSKFFKVSELNVTGEQEFETDCESYNLVTLVSGEASIENERFKAGDSFFVPADYGKWSMKGYAKIIMTENAPRYFVGIDLGGTNIATAVVDHKGNIYGRARKKTRAPRPYTEILDDVIACAYECTKASGLDFEQIESIGMGFPGSIDKDTGVVVFANNLGFINTPVVDYIKSRLGKPIYIENDANAAAWGEYIAGSGKNTGSMIMITLGTGVGGGIIIDGKLMTGQWGMGGELGHTVIVVDGEPCNCGRNGCLEAYTSATALVRQTKKAMEENPDSDLWRVVNGDINAVNGKTPFLAKDDVAKNVIDRYLSYLAEGVLNVTNVFQPEIITIGGGISHEGEAIIEPLKKRLEKHAYTRFSAKHTEIKLAKLGNDAGIIGAALLGI